MSIPEYYLMLDTVKILRPLGKTDIWSIFYHKGFYVVTSNRFSFYDLQPSQFSFIGHAKDLDYAFFMIYEDQIEKNIKYTIEDEIKELNKNIFKLIFDIK